MHVNRERINGNRYGGWLVAMAVLESLNFIGFHFPAHRAKVGRAFGQRWWGGGRAGCLHLNVDTRVETLECLSP